MYTILLIEDNAQTARMVQKVLETADMTVHYAPNGMTGLGLAQEYAFDLILLDIHLPDLDGKVVAANLRGNVAPIIAFSADDSPRSRKMAAAFGCHNFIAKPINTRLFPTQITEMIAHHREAGEHA
ncbi:MAG TPA: response regulator [Aggregatilineales bacterium]|nr:response regulator [Anaerolineales bacterium]HRE46276.1 response regulator [Aggregatilineales bacterium]